MLCKIPIQVDTCSVALVKWTSVANVVSVNKS